MKQSHQAVWLDSRVITPFSSRAVIREAIPTCPFAATPASGGVQ